MVVITNVRLPRVHMESVSPVLLISDEEQADEFYRGFLGFSFDRIHSEGGFKYLQISRETITLQLAVDESAGTLPCSAFIRMTGIEAYAQELDDKKAAYVRPSIKAFAGGRFLEIADPFGNKLRFYQYDKRR